MHSYNFIFVLKIADYEFHLLDNDLSQIGHTIKYKSDSLVKISDSNGFKFIYFDPSKYLAPRNDTNISSNRDIEEDE